MEVPVNVYYVMGFRPSYFTCIAHLYLYYTLLVPHTYASCIRHWCIFSHYEIQYKSSSISNMVLEPLLWLFLGSLVFIGIILDSQLLPPLQLLLQPFVIQPLTRFSHCLWFWTCSCRHSESRDHCHTVAAVIFAPIVFLQVPLRSSSTDLPSHGNLTIIEAPTCRHVPPKDSAQKLTRLHAPPDFPTRLHVPSVHLLTSALSDVITSTSSADITRQSADVIVDQDVDQTVDFDR